jgi:hypothetical protein
LLPARFGTKSFCSRHFALLLPPARQIPDSGEYNQRTLGQRTVGAKFNRLASRIYSPSICPKPIPFNQ